VADESAAARLRRWSFNAVGADSDRALAVEGLPFLPR
jgi:hypothetical protein